MCTIMMKDHLIGKNYDSVVKTGMIYTNKRGLIKQAAPALPDVPLEWVASHGSITFSQAGREYPVSGMNEAGLVVEQATFQGTVYPEPDGRPTVSSLEMTQFLLDTCADTEDALEALEHFAIVRTSWPVHYVFADTKGNMAVAEYRGGAMHIYRGTTHELKLLTNTEYRQDEDLGECRQAGDLADLLESRKRPETVWSNIYDLQERSITVRKSGAQEEIMIKLQAVDFSFGSRNQMMDIAAEETVFRPYEHARNHELISAFFHHPRIAEVMALPDSNEVIDFMSEQPNKYDKNHQTMLRFLSRELISQLPMKHAHKLLVLKYLASKFEAGKEYSERQVNAIIDEWHTFGDYFKKRADRQRLIEAASGRLKILEGISMMKIPTTLKHKPVIVGEGYGNIDGRYAYKTDVQGLSLGLAQWNDRGKLDISAKVWRYTGEKWSRQSEEMPLHRVLDLAIFVCEAEKYFREAYRYEKLYDPENPVIDRVGLQGDAMTVKVCTENDMIDEDIKTVRQALADDSELLGERFSALSRLLKDLGY